MPLFTTSDVLTEVRDTIQDSAAQRWPDAELKRYLLAGMRKIAQISPGAGPTSEATVTLAAGISQSVTTNSGRTVARVMDVLWNMSGGNIGGSIRKASKDQFDAQGADWTTATASATVKYWMPLEDEPTSFLVSPPNTGAGTVRVKLSLVPSSADTIEVTDAAKDALVAYVIHRAWAKDATYSKQSADYLAIFNSEMQVLTGANKLAGDRVHERNRPR